MIALLLLACTTQPSGPWTGTRALTPALARLDTDKDGRVTEGEWARVQFHGGEFSQVDTDHDGAISLAELRVLTFAQDPATFYEPGEQRDLEQLLAGPGVDVAKLALQLQPDRGPLRTDPGPMPGGARDLGNGPDKGGAGSPGPDKRPPGRPEPGEPARGPGPDAQGPGAPEKGGAPPPAVDVSRQPYSDKRGGQALRPPEPYTVLQLITDEIRAADPAAVLPSDERIETIGRRNSLRTPEALALLAELEKAADKAGAGFPASLRAANVSAPAAVGRAPALPAD